MTRVRVAIIDVGANTLRLLVAGPSGQQVIPVHVEREALRLGEEIERHGYITAPKCAEAAEAFAAIVPPMALLGLGTGGTARALRKVTGGGVLDGESLESAIERLALRQRAKIAKRFGVAPQRAATLLAGSILFAEAQRRIGLPFRVASGGVREGCALALFRES